MKALQFTWRNADTLITLVVAVAFAVLGVLGHVKGESLTASAIGVMALIGVVLLHEREARESMKGQLAQIDNKIRSLEIRIIPPAQIGSDIERAVTDASFWHYKGSLGGYLRAVTLNENGERSQRVQARRDIYIQIIDPTNEEVCGHCSEYRRQVEPRSKAVRRDGSIDHVRVEAYATILAACIFQDRYPFLRMYLGLTSTVSSFRYDLTSRCVIITHADPQFPALKAEQDTHYYERYRYELELSFEQSRKLSLERVRGKLGAVNYALDIASVCGLFGELGVSDPAFLTDDHVNSIIQEATKPTNPYPR